MYSYQHRYHAGNFADLHKHLVLVGLLQALAKKETPFAVLDAYAGEGLYNLTCSEAKKNKEHALGIDQVAALTNAPPLISALRAIQARYQSDYSYPIYAGSPALIQAHLRAQDRAVFIENHPGAYERLAHHFHDSAGLQIQKRDAFEALKALTPFPEKRGLILMDPSYERKEEYHTVAAAVLQSYHKFKTGIYAIWYPLLAEARHEALLQAVKDSDVSSAFYCEWIPNKDLPSQGLYGSGMILINPPWQLDSQLTECFEYLKRTAFREARACHRLLTRSEKRGN
jgi:23S rRNA (adenine2030-N6)-methyltransferase